MQCANSGTFRLWMFFVVSSFKEKFKNQTLKSAQNKYIRFCLNLHPRSRIDLSDFRKRKLRSARDRVEHWLVNTVLSTKMELYPDIHEMFKPSFLKYSIKSLVSLDIPLWETNAGQRKVIYLWAKNMVKNKP